MLNPDDRIKDQHVVSPVPSAPPAPTAEPVPDVVEEVSAASSSRGREREDMLKRGILMLRLFAFLFSLLASIFMASNRHGDGKDFDNYEEYRYLLAIACISTVYSGGQGLRYANKISIGRQQREEQNSFSMIDLVGDEVAAYLLVSAASAAVPQTKRILTHGESNNFTKSLATAITMAFLAFLSLALSTLCFTLSLWNITN
ncbi:hypothetical protein CCACVL1_09356 [Corchorus capsularis]|uniref:CASP-like protein n=1 Tax=Corchorus capsularis TaxID=210143 RepID=A0A1R3IWS2_COCAP|nr:hypothetical protein CCACVL1_09356 [Corchorus capsularis]